jgi:hypothetical protein
LRGHVVAAGFAPVESGLMPPNTFAIFAPGLYSRLGKRGRRLGQWATHLLLAPTTRWCGMIYCVAKKA